MRPDERWEAGRGIAGPVALAVVALAGIGRPHDAEACGGFFPPGAHPNERPRLGREATLIVFDAARRREHFVREVTFRRSRSRFGFVVPTPTRPEVAPLARSPFAELRVAFPFREPPRGLGGLGLRGTGRGGGGGAGVEVLEVRRVGSFTAFVLAADDAAALAAWLAENGLVQTPETEPWLAHYVRLRFFYVAMRYDPPRGPVRRQTTAEAMRISFDTPLPYYPYYEPELPAGQTPVQGRRLDVWLASAATYVPVTLRERDGRKAWVRPFAEGIAFEDAEVRPMLAGALGAEASILPSGTLRVQRFGDGKNARTGFGDVLFAPRTAEPGLRTALMHMLPILDPSLWEHR